jgi:hypothetical protein
MAVLIHKQPIKSSPAVLLSAHVISL